MSSAARVIRLEMPSVDGDRVTYRWTEPDASPFQRASSFELVYPGVPLAAFSLELLVEIFISLQWKVFGLHKAPVLVELPVTMPRASIAWWQGFSDAPLVDAAPLGDSPYSAWSGGPVVREPRSLALFFGGGKDSTLGRSALAEIAGEDEVLLVQFVQPMVRVRGERDRLRVRQHNLIIEPALRGTRLAAAGVETDYIVTFHGPGWAARPHTNLYTIAALPVLLHRGVKAAFMSIEMTAYWCRTGENGEHSFGFPRSRPEVYAGQSAHLAAVAGVEIEYGNTSAPISELGSYRILLERYPAAFERIVMCGVGELDRRWCMKCKKCAEYVLFGLLCGRRHHDIDYRRFWSESTHIQKLLALAAESQERHPETGNVLWQKGVSTAYHVASFSHAMAALRSPRVQALIPAEARSTLDPLAAAWGNRPFEAVEWVSGDAVELVDTPLMRSMAAIYAQHLPLKSGPFRGLPFQNHIVDLDFTQRTDPYGRPRDRIPAE